MKLATLRNGTRDGALIVVGPRGDTYTHAAAIAPTLQSALDEWTHVETPLRHLADARRAVRSPSHLLDATSSRRRSPARTSGSTGRPFSTT